jgi:hypothetical protein
MDNINEQRDVADQIGRMISDPSSLGIDMDDVRDFIVCSDEPIQELPLCMQEDLKKELEELEQEDLNERLAGAEHAPVHLPPGARREQGSDYYIRFTPYHSLRSQYPPPVCKKRMTKRHNFVLSKLNLRCKCCAILLSVCSQTDSSLIVPYP